MFSVCPHYCHVDLGWEWIFNVFFKSSFLRGED